MATINQIEYIIKVKDKIKEPVLIVGSKNYDFDSENIETVLKQLGFRQIIGIDIIEGEGVHRIVDICDEDDFLKEYESYFNTVFCMEVLTHVKTPWKATENINRLTRSGGYVILSECFVRKLSRMPADFWRFTYDGFKILYRDFDFIDDLAMKSLTRSKHPDLKKMSGEIFQIMHQRVEDEAYFGYFLRKIHRRFFAGKLFKVSRLLPEQTFYAIGKKK